jgi:hypothetical protein
MTSGYPYAPLHNISAPYPPMPFTGISSAPFLPTNSQPLVWFPVKGPAPFTTMVVVHEVTSYGDAFGPPNDGSMLRYSGIYKTSLTYPNYQPESPPGFQHSTTASLFQLRADDSTWTLAVDQVNDCFFDEGGVWTISLNFAMRYQGGPTSPAAMFCRVSSWVLLTGPDI